MSEEGKIPKIPTMDDLDKRLGAVEDLLKTLNGKLDRMDEELGKFSDFIVDRLKNIEDVLEKREAEKAVAQARGPPPPSPPAERGVQWEQGVGPKGPYESVAIGLVMDLAKQVADKGGFLRRDGYLYWIGQEKDRVFRRKQ